jgi:3D (Asp-Asp-Asp) domain-containing protein
MIELANAIVAKTRTQRTARRLLIAACSIIGFGVVGSIAANAMTGGKQPTAHFVSESPSIAAMASNKTTSGNELIHNAVAPAAGNSHVVWMNVTAYCPCAKCCGKNAAGVTASGKPISFDNGHFVAAPSVYGFGTKLIIAGYNGGQAVQVLDRGGAIKGNHLDVFFPTHDQAKAWGRRWIAVTVVD